jgi:hypothetical protein
VVLHISSRATRAKTKPGKRYDVLQIDCGCYVHLLGTAAPPTTLVGEAEDDRALEAFYGDLYGGVSVPEEDYRAIRRSVLDLPSIIEAIGATSAPLSSEISSPGMQSDHRAIVDRPKP